MQQEDRQQLASSARRSWMAYFVRNGHMTVVTLVALVLGGVAAIASMPVESAPEVKIPIATVAVPYPGASPADVENLVTDELESAIADVDDIEQLTSVSREGVATLTVQFRASADIDASIRELRDTVDTATADLPDDAGDPVVTQIRAGDQSIVSFVIVGEAPLDELDRYAEELSDDIEDIAGVRMVSVSGLPEQQLQVLVDIAQLEGYEMSVAQVQQAIEAAHVNLPIGSIRTDNLYYQVSFRGQVDNVTELENLVIGSREGRTIFLRDVATVRNAFAPPDSVARAYVRNAAQPYRPAVTLQVFKQVGADLIEIVDTAKQRAREYETARFARDVDLLITDDFSQYIRDDISRLLMSAWQTVLLIGVVLLLALGRREALAAALTIPILYLLSFIGLAAMGSTFNFLTFFALILSLGVVVDTSVVIIEGTYENMQRHGMKSDDAALASVATFRSPLTSGTLTTIAAFLPLALMSGIMGEYVKHIPITVVITLIASLATALLLLPAIAAWLLRHTRAPEKTSTPLLQRGFSKLHRWYDRYIARVVHTPVMQKRWLQAMAVAMVGAVVLSMTGILRFQLFPPADAPFFNVIVSLPEGTALERTQTVAATVEEELEKVPEVDHFITVYGSSGANEANITVTLTPREERERESTAIVETLRREVQNTEGADVRVQELQSGPPGGAPVQIRLLGDDTQVLQDFSREVVRMVEAVDGATDVRDDLELSPGEFALLPKRDRLEYFGLTAREVGIQLRTAVFGNDSVTVRRNGDEIPIVVQLDYRRESCVQQPLVALREARDKRTICRSVPQSVGELERILIPTPRGQVSLSELVEVELQPSLTALRHFNTDRVVNVQADITDGTTAGEVFAAVREQMATVQVPDGVRIEYGGENEDTQESLASLRTAAVIGLLLIFMILLEQFGRFRQVWIILVTMPLAVMGVLYGLAILRLPFSFPGLIGVTALLGIVVNDAIVLIDRFNVLRGLGYSLPEAVSEGAKQRMEPVLITTITTALGVLPLIFSGDEFSDLAVVMAVGIVIATVFTLVVIPVLYVRWEGKTGPGYFRRQWHRAQAHAKVLWQER